ncbi:MAG: hypothetical protein CVV02_01580 [Firmicutes bacterium HGW-Firmicutes-7]|nr:MAG: hypothetical protein CVV02_01580 [Firmicutes bacterium HGW-Firmicutes-7]
MKKSPKTIKVRQNKKLIKPRGTSDKDKKITKGNEFNKDIQIIAVWGSPSSGKTILSIQLAKYLAKEKKNVMLIHDDVFCPVLPITFPSLTGNDNEKSLGKILSSPTIDQSLILNNAITLKHSDYIAVLGHQKGENPLTYSEYSKETVLDFLLLTKHLVDYVIIDCTSITTESILTITALEMADKVIRLSTADFKGLSYLKSFLPLLIDPKFNTENHLRVISPVKPFQDSHSVNDIIRGSSIFVPYLEEIGKQDIEGRLYEITNNKEYNRVIKQIFEVIHYEQ